MLETYVVLTGLHEEEWEDPEPRHMLVDKEQSVIAPGENEEERLANANAIKIVKMERIGCFNPTKGRPIAIKFAFKNDADWVLSCRKTSIKAYLWTNNTAIKQSTNESA